MMLYLIKYKSTYFSSLMNMKTSAIIKIRSSNEPKTPTTMKSVVFGVLGASVEVGSSSDVVWFGVRSVTAVFPSLVDDKPSVLTVMVVVVDSVLSSGVVDSNVLISVDVVLLSVGVVDSSGSTDVV